MRKIDTRVSTAIAADHRTPKGTIHSGMASAKGAIDDVSGGYTFGMFMRR